MEINQLKQVNKKPYQKLTSTMKLCLVLPSNVLWTTQKKNGALLLRGGTKGVPLLCGRTVGVPLLSCALMSTITDLGNNYCVGNTKLALILGGNFTLCGGTITV